MGRADFAGMNLNLSKCTLLIVIMLLTGCANQGYNYNNADIVRQQLLLNYSAQMLNPVVGAHVYGLSPAGAFMYNATPYPERFGVICNTFGNMTSCTEY